MQICQFVTMLKVSLNTNKTAILYIIAEILLTVALIPIKLANMSYVRPNKNICLFTVTSSKKIGQVGRISILFYFFILFHIRKFQIADLSYPEKVPDFRIYLIALRSEGVIIPQKNCCARIIKKLMPIIFQDVTGNSFFRPKISDVSTFTFDLPRKQGRSGNRKQTYIFFGLKCHLHCRNMTVKSLNIQVYQNGIQIIT